MLKTKENIKKYLDNLNLNVALDLISSNFLKYILSDIYPLNDTDIKAHSFYKMNFSLKQSALLSVCSKFNKYNIRYIVFKGIVLSHRLYTNYKDRYIGDLDIYVDKKDFEAALDILFEDGFRFFNDDISGDHHIVLCKNQIIIELHKNILNPFTKINEEYLLSHTSQFAIKNIDIITFDHTATLLHLLYHLYMDMCLAYNNDYLIFAQKRFPHTARFLSRTFEIALYTEKYYDFINWNEIIVNLQQHQLRFIFKIMINEIVSIFPDIFSYNFLIAIDKLSFLNNEKNVLYQYIMHSRLFNIDEALPRYIDEHWLRNESINLNVIDGNSFLLNNTILKNTMNSDYSQKFTCKVSFKKCEKGFKLKFLVNDNDIYFSALNDYNTQTSDGIHLIICGTEKYSYNSIFLFPKIIDNKIVVIPIDVLNNKNSKIAESYISATFQKTKSGYIIAATLKENFLKKNHIEKYFYLGLVVSDCSSVTKSRKAELILSNPHNQWYNPIYFAKIHLN